MGQLWGEARFSDEHDNLLVFERWNEDGFGRVAGRRGNFFLICGLDAMICVGFVPVFACGCAADVADAKTSDDFVSEFLGSKVGVVVDLVNTEHPKRFERRTHFASDGVAKVRIGGFHFSLEESVMEWVGVCRGEGT